MSKRTPGLPRQPRDLYQTPPEAVAPLLPFLPPACEFDEPCAAAGLLVDALVAAGHRCASASDIVPLRADIEARDALDIDAPPAGRLRITNPPWSRPLMHKLILHLAGQGTTWLLFDAGWIFTKQSRRFQSRLRKVVAVGRVKWIFPGSTKKGYDDAAWHEFGHPSGAPTEFYGPGAAPLTIMPGTRTCLNCRRTIGRHDKWKLIDRGGIATCVHRHCDNPESYHPRGQELLPAPLLDLIDQRQAVAA